jgi:hypothetical protein
MRSVEKPIQKGIAQSFSAMEKKCYNSIPISVLASAESGARE